MWNKILTWALFVHKYEKNKIRTWEIDVTSPLYFSWEFLFTVYTNFKNFAILHLKKRHCIQCNAYTLKLTCTVNLSRLYHVKIQVTLFLINTKFFNVILNILLNSRINCTQVTNKVAATLLLKAREISRFKK